MEHYLKIDHLISRKINGILVQIFSALIAYRTDDTQHDPYGYTAWDNDTIVYVDWDQPTQPYTDTSVPVQVVQG